MPKPKQDTIVSTVRLPVELNERLKAHQAEHGGSIPKIIAAALEALLAPKPGQARPDPTPPVYLPPRLVEWLDGRFREREAGLSFVAEFGVFSLWQAEADLAGRFTEGELLACIDMANGSFFYAAQTGPQYLALSIADGCALEGWADKWGFDRDAMLAKVSGLTKAESAGLFVWAKAFWERHTKEDPREYVKTLAAKEESR